jgi:hypothetical protein
MKCGSLILFLNIAFLSILQAQEQLPCEKKVVYGKNGKLFVNSDLGIYLWLSSSPDEQSKKVRLVSDSSQKYTNPMYFDTEGYNTIRSPWAVDTNSKRIVYPLHDIIFEVYSDGKAPITKVYPKGTAIRTKKGGTKYKDQVNIELKAVDGISGIDKTYYSVDNNPYTAYINMISVISSGKHVLKFYSTDNVGNREQPREYRFIVETPVKH